MELTNYFGVDQINQITWAHAANTKSLFDTALSSNDAMFIEVDITASDNGELIAAHWPEVSSDLTFNRILDRLQECSKGLKIDFKNEAVIETCLHELAKRNLTVPIILNADILSVADAPAPDIDGKKFIDTCLSLYPTGLISVGWRTTEESMYTLEDIEQMKAYCTELDYVTFPVRAVSLPRSESISTLLDQDGRTLSIWNSEPISQETSAWLSQNLDPRRCFYDFETE